LKGGGEEPKTKKKSLKKSASIENAGKGKISTRLRERYLDMDRAWKEKKKMLSADAEYDSRKLGKKQRSSSLIATAVSQED